MSKLLKNLPIKYVYKIMTSILRRRLEAYTERRIGDYQCGFRKGKSTVDPVHVMG